MRKKLDVFASAKKVIGEPIDELNERARWYVTDGGAGITEAQEQALADFAGLFNTGTYLKVEPAQVLESAGKEWFIDCRKGS